jgi:GH24 family phage-related lysozyme (muramidase)
MKIEITDATTSLVKKFEKFSSTIYPCLAGKPTIGYGHVVNSAEKIKYKNGISSKEADDLLRQDLQDAVNCLKRLIKVDLHPDNISALISLVFNVGCGEFASSKALKLINDKNLQKAKIELFDPIEGFVRIDGKITKGLVNRRALEAKLWKNYV